MTFPKDLNHLYQTTIGFDQALEYLFSDKHLQGSSFPPYNIVKIDEERYTIEMALAGFSEDEVYISLKGQTLAVKSNTTNQDEDTKYLHKGIAKRNFVREFSLSSDVIVTGADLVNGMLVISLIREVPENKKSRQIPIGGTCGHSETQLNG